MRIFSVHTRMATRPVLVPERFSWGATIFGPFWLLAHRAWIAAILVILVTLLINFAPREWRWALDLSLVVSVGLFGQDLRRWSLARRGFLLAHIVAARDQDEAMARLLARRPDLIEAALR